MIAENDPIAFSYLSEWTTEDLKRFRKAYNKAKKRKIPEEENTFIFSGHPFLLNFAKYLIVYLEGRFAANGGRPIKR